MDFTTLNAFVVWASTVLYAANRGLTKEDAVLEAVAMADALEAHKTWS